MRTLKPNMRVNELLMECDEVDLAQQFTIHVCYLCRSVRDSVLEN